LEKQLGLLQVVAEQGGLETFFGQVENAQRQRNGLQAEVVELAAQQAEVEATIGERKREKAQLDDHIAMLHNERDKARVHLNKLEDEQKRLVIQRAEVESAVEKLKRQNGELEDKIAKLRSEQEDVQTHDQAQSKIIQLESEQKKLFSAQEELVAQLAESKSEAARLKKDISQLEKQISVIENERDKAQAQFRNGQKKWGAEKADLESVITNLEQRTEHLDNQKPTASKEQSVQILLALLSTKLGKARSASTALQERLRPKRPDWVKTASLNVHEMYPELASIQQELEEAEAEISAYREPIGPHDCVRRSVRQA
jgi:chromosome segregation ATPase